MSYQPLPPVGQDDMAGSLPVVIASDQSAVPVSGTVTANLSATDNAVLDDIAAKLATIDADTGSIAAEDFATETTLSSINTKTPALGQALAAASVPVVLTAAQVTTLTPPAAITGFATETTLDAVKTALEGTLDVDTGLTQPLTDTELRATPVPVSGTVTANLSATDNAVLDDIAADTESIKTAVEILDNAISGSEMQVDVLTMPTVTVTATNLDVQSGGADLATSTQAGAIQTAVELLDDTVTTLGTTTYTEATSKGITIGAVRRDADTTLVNTTNEFGPLQMDANGRLKVEAFSGETLPVSLASVPSHAVTNAGTFAVQVSSLPASTNTIEVVGDIAHDTAASGNPVRVGVKAETSPKGITLVADGDVTEAYADADGLQMVKLSTSGADLISERVSNTDGNSTAFTNFSSVASTKNYITGFSVFRTDAGTTPIYVDFRDGTAGSILWSAVIPPNAGANNPAYCGPALFKTSAATALAYDVSAATTTVYISVSGYQSKV